MHTLRGPVQRWVGEKNGSFRRTALHAGCHAEQLPAVRDHRVHELLPRFVRVSFVGKFPRLDRADGANIFRGAKLAAECPTHLCRRPNVMSSTRWEVGGPCRHLSVSHAPGDHEDRDLVIDIAIGFPDEFMEALPGLDCPEGQL